MRIIGNFLAGIVSFLYFFVLMGMILILFISNAFSENYYSNVLKSVEFNEVKLSDLGITEMNSGNATDITLEDALLGTLKEAGFSENDAKVIINNDQIKEIVGSFISDSVTYMATNEEIPQINTNDVKNILLDKEIKPLLKDVNENEIDVLVNEVNILLKKQFEGEVNYGK